MWHPPGGAAAGRPVRPAPDAPSFFSSPAQSPATRPTPPERGEEAQFSLLKAPPRAVPTTHPGLPRGVQGQLGVEPLLPLPVVRRTRTTGPGLCPAVPASCSPAVVSTGGSRPGCGSGPGAGHPAFAGAGERAAKSSQGPASQSSGHSLVVKGSRPKRTVLPSPRRVLDEAKASCTRQEHRALTPHPSG